MVEKIDMQRILSPMSPTAKTKKVDRNQTNMQQRRFYQELEQEEEEKKKRDRTGKELEKLPEVSDDEKTGGIPVKDSLEKRKPDKDKEKGEDIHGRIIDIIV